VGDTEILRNAPAETLVSGLGDMLAKHVSIVEWRISHILTGEYYCEAIADLVRNSLKACVDNVEGLLRREDEAVEAVFNGLVLCGMAMSLAGCSRPASGVEHYFSHLWDMRGAEFGTPTSTHGIQCALGTLYAVRLYETVKSLTPHREKALAYAENFDLTAWNTALREFLGRGAEAMIALEEKEGKYDPAKHATRLSVILDRWEELTSIMEELPAAAEVETVLRSVGCPLTVEELGLKPALLPMTLKASKDIRDKYVLSRLLWDLGVLDDFAERICEI
jgi:glycerol-1-phosphate dehydrogenase [NAD(P)+]